ncbi:MAG: exopolysaccharide biosynthesis polyprenyl glycosylphosphotransferase [Kiritimatiellae bacterium]|nr:exopolysaccharide biosynthesis polyprenyl glycosylphosphotransferase [Kiritimatiellia bacterium]
MESFLDRTKDADLEELMRELAARAGGNKRRSLRLRAWKFTVFGAYAVKRLIDIAGSAIGLVLLSPVFLAIAVAVKLSSPGPVFFKQVRVGRYGRHFDFYKFRSMRQDAEARKAALMDRNESKDGVIFKMKDDPRITKVGKFLRRTSLDELPQLWNVLIGDMSLVGPRPPVPSEVREYTLEDRKRLDVIPGITCLWQIKGRSEIPFNEQVRLDKEYILAPGVWKDILILLKTIPAIIGGKGAY